jgi:ferredoxin
LIAWGVSEHDVHFEAFGPASVSLAGAALQSPESAPDAPVEVQFRRSGRTLLWNAADASLLDFAERHGLLLASGCRAGSCGTCETGLVSGTVRYTKTPDHEVAPDHCLLCIAKPGSALVLDT